MAFCNQCGAQLNNGAQFCPKCGQQINFVKQQTDQPQQQYSVLSDEDDSSTFERIYQSGWSWLVAIVLIIVLFNLRACSTDQLEKDVKKLMIATMKERGQDLKISFLTIVHQEGNYYIGIAKGTLNGKRIEFDVNVVYDGIKLQAEWEPTSDYEENLFRDKVERIFGY